VSVTQDGDGVTVGVRAPSGDYEVGGAYLIGADGENSAVRELAGFDAPPAGPSWYGLVAHVEDYTGPPGGITSPGGMFGALPDTAFQHLMTTEFGVDRPGDDVPVTFDEVKASVLKITGQDVTGGQPQWLARYGNTSRLASSYRVGRVFLAGDAAHVHFHAVGHGLNTGLNDAVNLGWKLAAEINGWAPTDLLDSYDRERHPVGERAVQVMLAQLSLLTPLENLGPLRALFTELSRGDEVIRQLVGAITNVRYPFEQPGGGGDQPVSPLLGGRIENLVLSAGRGAVVDLSSGAADLAVAAGWADRVDAVTGDPGWQVPAAAVLVRPDGHVAWVAETGVDAKGLAGALETWFGAPAPQSAG
jgi:hypothetical protein